MAGRASTQFLRCLFIASIGMTCAQPPDVQPDVPAWKLTHLYSVGAEPGTTELQVVQSVQLLRDHRLLIADVGAGSIIVVDSLGRRRPSLGRTGSGPGEFQEPQALGTIGDTVAVLDPRNARIGLFASDGSWQGSWIAQPITGGSYVRLYRVPGPEFYALGVRRTTGVLASTFIRFDVGGARDTLVPDPIPSAPDAGVTCEGTDGGIRFFSAAFQPRHLRIPGPHGTLLDADMSTYRIVQHTAAGDTVTTFTGPSERVPIADSEWDSAGTEFATYLKDDPRAKCSSASLTRPPHKPAIRAFWWDDTGRLWVERYVVGGFAFDLFTSRGVLAASMRAPERVGDVEPSVVGDRIALLGATPDGAHVVHVYRIVPPQ